MVAKKIIKRTQKQIEDDSEKFFSAEYLLGEKSQQENAEESNGGKLNIGKTLNSVGRKLGVSKGIKNLEKLAKKEANDAVKLAKKEAQLQVRNAKKQATKEAAAAKRKAKAALKKTAKYGKETGKQILQQAATAAIATPIAALTGSPIVGAVASDQIMQKSGLNKKIDGLGIGGSFAVTKHRGGSFRPSGGSVLNKKTVRTRDILGISGPYPQLQNTDIVDRQNGKRVTDNEATKSGSGFLPE